jgi:hypothetical protein
MKKAVITQYALATDDQVYGHRKHATLLKRTKRGFPAGTQVWRTKTEAQQELEYQRRAGFFPLFMHSARVVDASVRW